MIATDLMSRGMDFKNVGCVINYDCPSNRTTYIHRIGTLFFLLYYYYYLIFNFKLGRTGRAGQKGKAITFYSSKDMAVIRSISNVVRESGGTIPAWMRALDKNNE